MYKTQSVISDLDIPGAAIIISDCNHYAIDRQSDTFRTFFIIDGFSQEIWYIEANTAPDYDRLQNNIRISDGTTAKGWVSGYHLEMVALIQQLDISMRSAK